MGVSWAVSVSSRVSGYHVTLVELKAIDGSSTGEVFALEKIHVRISLCQNMNAYILYPQMF